MAEYKHGSMDVQSHQRGFQGFIKTIIWVAGISIGTLIFLAVFNS